MGGICLFNREIEGHSLWAWTAAAVSAPMLQFLGSVPWHWSLLGGLGAGALWLLAERAGGVCRWKPAAAVQLLFLIVCAGAAAAWSGACWIGAERPWTVPGVLLVLAACASETGPQAGARCGAVVFWFLAGMLLLLCAFALPDVKWAWLAPAEEGPRLPAALLLVPAVGGLLPRKRGSSPWPWALGLGLGGVAVSLLTVGALSPAVAGRTQGAFFEMARGISILGVAERFEAVVAAAMTLGWFCLLSLLLTAAGKMAETLHTGWGRPGVWLSALGAAALMPWGREAPPWLLAAGAILLWCLLPIACGKQKKEA